MCVLQPSMADFAREYLMAPVRRHVFTLPKQSACFVLCVVWGDGGGGGAGVVCKKTQTHPSN